MKTIIQIVIGSILLVIGAIVNQFFIDYNDRIRYLERRTEISEGILSRTPISKDDISIKYKEEILNDISFISVKLYNFSDKDFEDIPVYIDLNPVSKSSVEVLVEYASGAKRLPVKEIEVSGLKEDPRIVRYGYLIKAANRLEDNEIFSSSFVVAGNVAPIPSIEIQKKGLESREFSRSSVSALSRIQILAIILLVIILIVAYVMFLVYIERQLRKREPKIDKEIVDGIISSEQFKNKIGTYTPDADMQSIVSYIVSESRKRNRWINIPKFLRKYYTNLDPDRP